MDALRHRYRVLREVPGPRPVAVFKAADRILGCEVAVKTTPVDHALAEDLIAEGERHHPLRHPGLVPVTSRFAGLVGFDAKLVVGLATRWIDGPDLVSWAARRSDTERLTAVAELCSTLSWLHRRGWMHLDLKPGNVVMSRGRPVVLDLGTALPLGAGTSTAGGTLGYAAPEVVQGEAPHVSSDLFSVGVVLFEMMTGALPFPGEGSLLRRNVIDGRRRSLRGLRPDLDPGLIALIDALLSPVAADRTGSADALVRELVALGARPREPEIPEGEAPLRGRDEALDAIDELIETGVQRPIQVVGPRGVGRQRLVRAHLSRVSVSRGAWLLDLTQAVDGPYAALRRLIVALDAPGRGDLEDPRMADWTAGLSDLRGDVYVGRWSEALRPWLSVLRGLAAAGLRVWSTSDAVREACQVVAPARLTEATVRDLVLWLAVDQHPRASSAIARADGCMGEVFRRLTAPSADPSGYPAELREAWPLLCALPWPVRPHTLARLPPDVRQACELAVERGLIEERDGYLRPTVELPAPARDEPPSPALHAFGQSVLGQEHGLSEPQAAVLAARTGNRAAASAWLSKFDTDYARRADVAEVADRLASSDEPHACRLAGWSAFQEGDTERLHWIIDLLAPDEPVRSWLARLEAGRDRTSSAAFDSQMAWLERHGDDPQVRAEALYALMMLLPRPSERILAVAASWDQDPQVDASWRACPPGLAALLGAYATTIEKPGHRERVRELLQPFADAEAPLHILPNTLLYAIGVAAQELGDEDMALRVTEAMVHRADALGLPYGVVMSRRRYGGMLMDYNRAEPSRRYLLEALGLAEQHRNVREQHFVHGMLAELEIGCHRLPAALRHLRRFEETMEKLGDGMKKASFAQGRILWASYHHAQGSPHKAVQLLADESFEDREPMVRTWRALVLMESYNDLGAYEQSMQIAASLSSWPSPNVQRRVQIAKGRAHLGLARAHLQRAVADLPDQPDPMVRGTIGRALLAAGGEDLDPRSFGRRRDLLERARNYLVEEDMKARAVALRERLLEGPGAALDQIVRLIESVGDGPRMLEIVAQVVSDALSANRVLVMLRMPGLGRQLTAREISGQESAGLAPEIWRRVRNPGDVWLSEDAFADPNLRRMSATVRTFQIKSVVAVAIPRGGQVIGALYVDDVHRAGRFGPADVAILQRLASAIGNVAEAMPMRSERDGLTVHDLHGLYTCDGEVAARIQGTLDRAAASPQTNLLLCGPTGVGKTWLARRVATEVLGLDGLIEVVMHPGPTEMLVSQLWGTRRGDFTGAVERAGSIFQAWSQNCALFIDELQNLDEIGQRVLLPLLELPRRRFGSLTTGVRELDRPLHVILGTNAVLDHGAWAQVFREDLWYRISPVRIDLPPLAERGREAVYRHLEDLLNERGLPAPEDVFERGALQRISTHSWPGNLRTLSNLAEQAALRFREDGRQIPAGALDGLGLRERVEEAVTRTGEASPTLLSAQARAVLDALERHNYVQAAAAEELGLSKFALHRKLKKLDLIDHVREQRHLRRRMRDGS